MSTHKIGVGLASVMLAASLATAAAAQSSASATPPAPPTGPALPGVCVLSNEGVVYGSTVGKAVIARLNQLGAQTDAELSGEQTSIQNDAKALEAQRSSLSSDQFQQRGAAINQRAANLQRLAQQRQREMAATQEKALARIGTEADPIVRQVFAQRSCSLLFNGAALVFPAPAMDITPQVVQGLNGRIQSFSFDREHLDQQSGAGR